MPEIDRSDIESSVPLTVLQSLSPPDGTTKYVVQLSMGMPDSIHLKYFSWREAIFGKYDVFHVHWPEFLLRADSKSKIALKTIALATFLLRIKCTKRVIVRTIHNTEPHESGGFLEKYFTAKIDEWTSVFIRLNPTTPYPAGKVCVTIPHGHYKDWFAENASQAQIEGRVLSCGLIRPYKGIEELLELYSCERESDTTLRIVGKPQEKTLRLAIEQSCQRNQKVSARLAFVPDDELVEEIYKSAIVVLPYRHMHNSGIVFLALSLGRPVLVPKNEVNELLASEVGRGWIHMFTQNISLDDIHRAIASSEEVPAGARPNLSGRDWSSVGLAHRNAYETAIALGFAGSV